MNLHRSETFRNVRILLTDDARHALSFLSGDLRLHDLVGGIATLTLDSHDMLDQGFVLPALPPLTPAYFEITLAS